MSQDEVHQLRQALEVMVESAFWRLCFFDLVDDDDLDPDLSVAQLEDIADSLLSGGPVVRGAFEQLAARVAAHDSRPQVREWARGAVAAVWDDREGYLT